MTFLPFYIAGAISITLFMIYVMCYRRCPSNKILAVYGKVGKGQSVKCYHGGGAFIIPLIQGYDYLDLIPMTFGIPLKSALSYQNIRINIPSTFTVAISIDPEIMNNAAVRLLELSRRDIEAMAHEIIVGQLRLTVASLTIEQINQDRERFLDSIKQHVIPELRKIGLDLINVNITDIHDESGYIDSIGKKAASMAINQAKIDVAEQEKKGDIGKALAERERRIRVAEYRAESIEGENKAQSNVFKFNADMAEQEAIGEQRSQIAKQKAEVEIQTEKAHAEKRRLEAEEIVGEEINKRKKEIVAEASAEKQRREAKGEADAIRLIREAEAIGLQKVLAAKAAGYQSLMDACNNDPKAASTLLLVEKLEEIVKLQTEAIKNIKIDKITVWDNGSKDGGSTANFMSSLVKSLPALHDVTAMAGIELPEYLGKVVADADQARATTNTKEPSDKA